MTRTGVFFAAALAMGAVWPLSVQAADPIRIGAAEALSGPAARYGTMIKAGLDLAAEEINAKGAPL
ncbi:MAG: ABC transporter substrate-binding protein, partial [Rhodospirillales bacterium]|nr:ABC transporter substrate-binding protein [Rhodospirillales bacterium]